MENKTPLSPHIQIYKWHISSLVSISNRITGVINILTLSLICFWVWMLLLGNESYESIFNFLNSIFGKFFIIGFVWSYSFQILSEIRHWFWDLGCWIIDLGYLILDIGFGILGIAYWMS